MHREKTLIERIVKKRNIKNLYHFTQAENLKNISRYGLMPRTDLDDAQIFSFYNDDYRLDGCLNAVCLSIEFPNYKMFYKLRKDNPELDWAVIELSSEALYDFTCAFCWTNAGDASVYNLPLYDRMGDTAFESLFKDRPGYPAREELNLDDDYPTNPQAEVLVFDVIPPQYFTGVYFEDWQTMLNYQGKLKKISCVNVRAFSYRHDWMYWK